MPRLQYQRLATPVPADLGPEVTSLDKWWQPASTPPAHRRRRVPVRQGNYFTFTLVPSLYTTGPATSGSLRVVAQANRHRVYWKGKLVIDTTDASLNVGTRAGMFFRGASSYATAEDFYAEGI